MNFVAEPGGKLTYVYSYDISEQDLKVLERAVPAFASEELPKLETFVDRRLDVGRSAQRRSKGNFDDASVEKLKEDGIDVSRIEVRGI